MDATEFLFIFFLPPVKVTLYSCALAFCYVKIGCVSISLTFKSSGPSCSKLTMSLVNDSLKFTSSDTQIC